jgi:hypothetical protein
MSQSAGTQTKPTARADSLDERALAQVEKWMAVIREISGEPAREAASAGARLDRLLAPITE